MAFCPGVPIVSVTAAPPAVSVPVVSTTSKSCAVTVPVSPLPTSARTP